MINNIHVKEYILNIILNFLVKNDDNLLYEFNTCLIHF